MKIFYKTNNRIALKIILYTSAFSCLIILFCFLFFPERAVDNVLGGLSRIEFKLLGKVSPWFQQKADPRGPQIFLASHRGLVEKSSVENSPQSIEAALKNGFQGLEVDISFSSDFKPYIFHGPSLKLVGVEGIFSDFSSNQISKFRLHNNQPIISLETFCRLYVTKFKIIYLDIKGEDTNYKKKAKNLRRAIENYEIERIVLIGAPWRIIRASKKKLSRIKVGYEQKGAFANFILGADTVSLYYRYEFSFAEYKLAKFLGLDVVTWTVNDLKLLRQYSEIYRMNVLTDLNVKQNNF